MNQAQFGDGIWYALVLVLVGSALFSRRLSWRRTLAMIVAWAAIFAVVLIITSYRRELRSITDRVKNEIMGKPQQRMIGQTLRIMQADDGHYWVDASVNGKSARFLIDSGATITALSQRTAVDAGVDTRQDGRLPLIVQTANGPVEAERAEVDRFVVGPITTRNLPVMVSAEFGDVNVLGMNFLSQLTSWKVEHGEMVLTP